MSTDTTTLPPLPEITDEDREFLHYNPNTSDLVAFVQDYARRAIAQSAQAPAQPACTTGAAPKRPKCSRCNGERTIDQTGYGEYRPCPECNPESPYYEYPLARTQAPAQPAPSVEAVMGRALEWHNSDSAGRRRKAYDALRAAVEALARGAR